jgi:hypothetical protein
VFGRIIGRRSTTLINTARAKIAKGLGRIFLASLLITKADRSILPNIFQFRVRIFAKHCCAAKLALRGIAYINSCIELFILQVGRTEEIKDTLNPDFVMKFRLDYCFYKAKTLKFGM